MPVIHEPGGYDTPLQGQALPGRTGPPATAVHGAAREDRCGKPQTDRHAAVAQRPPRARHKGMARWDAPPPPCRSFSHFLRGFPELNAEDVRYCCMQEAYAKAFGGANLLVCRVLECLRVIAERVVVPCTV